MGLIRHFLGLENCVGLYSVLVYSCINSQYSVFLELKIMCKC